MLFMFTIPCIIIQFLLVLVLPTSSSSSAPCSPSTTVSNASSIYEALRNHGLPMGLFPKGVKDFDVGLDGRFWVHLDEACNAKFENELHYDRNVSGSLSCGKIDALNGIEAQDLFLWLPVMSIRVDNQSSGVICFDVGAVSKKFSLSLFETPPDCVAVQPQHVSEDQFGRLRYQHVQRTSGRDVL